MAESTVGFIGVPDCDINRGFAWWNLTELFRVDDPSHPGRKFPNIDDLAVDYANHEFLRITDVDYTNYTWSAIPFNAVDVIGGNEVTIEGIGSGSRSDYYPVYIDSGLSPATLCIHPLLRIPGSGNDNVKVFKGDDITETGIVISAYFDNGIYTGENIPLELCAVENVTNYTIKTAKVGSCRVDDLKDGETCTIVVYNDVGTVTLIVKSHVVLTNMALRAESPNRRIVDIVLTSPFISKNDSKLLMLPINIPIDDITIYGKIIYTDGERDISIDGNRMSLVGLRNSGAHDNFYISSQIGQEIDLLLSYKLASDESYIGEGLFENAIIRDYRATTLNIEGAYSVKLYVVPRWVDEYTGYILEYYLCNLERGTIFHVTQHIRHGVNSAVFNPMLYGVKQELVVTVDLSDVSGIFSPHIHVQNFSITLLAEGQEHVDNWDISYIHGRDSYGVGITADFRYVDLTYWTVDVSCGALDLTEWLKRLYYDGYPLYDIRTESGPVVPTHFNLIIGNKQYMHVIGDWHNALNIEAAVSEGNPVVIEWIHRSQVDDLHLGISPLPAHQI